MFPHYLLHPIYLAYGLAAGLISGVILIGIYGSDEKNPHRLGDGEKLSIMLSAAIGGIIAAVLISMGVNKDGEWDAYASAAVAICAFITGLGTGVTGRSLLPVLGATLSDLWARAPKLRKLPGRQEPTPLRRAG